MPIKTLCIDPGHGGDDPGATYNNMVEKDLNLTIARKLHNLLLVGYPELIVNLTRMLDENVSFKERNSRAGDAEFVVSIHANSGSPKLHGTTAYYYPQNKVSEAVCREILGSSHSVLRYSKKPYTTKPEGWRSRPHTVVCAFSAPCALIEVGFLTNKRDASFLKTEAGQLACACSIVNGLTWLLIK